jgi:hypothetical protein
LRKYALLFFLFAFTATLSPLSAQTHAIIEDTPFQQDYHEPHPLKTAGENDVRALRLDGVGRVWVATAEGVRFWEKGRWNTPEGGATIGNTYTLYRDTKGQVWAGAWSGLYRLTPKQVLPTELNGVPVGAIGGRKFAGESTETLFAASPQGIWRSDGAKWKQLEGAWHRGIRAILPTPERTLWIGTASGLYVADLKSKTPQVTLHHLPKSVLSSSIYALSELPDGTRAIGSTGGLDLYTELKRIRSHSAKVNDLPNRHARAIAQDSAGRLWVATKLGVARYEAGKWSLRHSRRWVLSDDCRDVDIDKNGTAWVATANGVSAIHHKYMTLADKAEHYLKILRARHIRPPGFVGPAVLARNGDLTEWLIEDDDNDGEHTANYLATEAFRYAVTKAPDAKANALQAARALEELQRITGTDHFIARSILPITQPPRHEQDRTFTPQEIADSHRTDPREKIIEKRWILTPDGKHYWKRDTSSDEVDGHLFGYSTYYTLVADEAEKHRIANVVDRIVGGIVRNGYVLQDIDGKATRWGVWSPERLNGDPTWHEERAGNSIEMIAFLGIAYAMTGKEMYRQSADQLITKHGYAKNALYRYETPSERTHIEDELLSIVYPGLMTYLIQPNLSAHYRKSIQMWYEAVRNDGIPLYDFVYNRFSGKRVSLTGSAHTLRDWPLDAIEWTVDNSTREDVERDKTPGVPEGFLKRILPRSEMGLQNWDQEPYMAVIGRNGEREDRPADWLLAYWMGRYYGFISAPRGNTIKD